MDRKCVTIFYYEKLWFSGRPCYDFRVDSEAMPGGIMMAGFIANDEGEISEAFLPPNLTNLSQDEQWDAIVAYCRMAVRGEKAEAPARATKQQESEEIARLAERRRLREARKAPWVK